MGHKDFLNFEKKVYDYPKFRSKIMRAPYILENKFLTIFKKWFHSSQVFHEFKNSIFLKKEKSLVP